ncbi:elongation factor P maturation arginine rhamnosyltransferase EarP [Rhodoferax sp.]|uniref:elongation factor P maturation arginine rhamnosyltransferase EarP n=1 Tax=Rhodoferax sp. TaxID=50421 RepID=UPI002ACEE0C5|nr:elongation factor P maturation arginine rhamnosyltransferase EarP [Rhodoferax sp.]MDZ7918563.1 elongation factor P maturation arginine rhamnosyltransferase EarP [Rhodoferax sp.]
MQWDIFCKVIDNFGDIGVCWRLCADLAHRGHRVRLWVDDASALVWMAPGAVEGHWPGVQVCDWSEAHNPAVLRTLPPADVWIEGFGCEIAPEFIAARAMNTASRGQYDSKPPVWINLEYLSAEAYVERCHALPSPVMQGPAQGWTKHFYYPGFTARTGGLLREPDYLAQQAAFDAAARQAWLAQHGIAWEGQRLVSLFCYEPPALTDLLQGLIQGTAPTMVLVTPGRAQRAVGTALTRMGLASTGAGALALHWLQPMPQSEFDELLWVCDLNLVRGEDSLVRAIWAGKPWLWHIYPQDDGAHADKLNALLDQMRAPATLRTAQLIWNGLAEASGLEQSPIDWGALPLADWSLATHDWRQGLLQMEDLGSQLIRFVQKKR